jgi:hypothetical protein
VYLILSQNHPYFEDCGKEITDEDRNLNSITERTQEMRRKEQNKGFILYVNKYRRAMYGLIHGQG